MSSVGISVRVQEFGGSSVDTADSETDIASVCAFAAADPSRYPLLSGVDAYDDTCFNPRQAGMLVAELNSVIERSTDESQQATAREVLRLAALLAVAPGRSHHRRLLFIGD
jgi:hypothetical protein